MDSDFEKFDLEQQNQVMAKMQSAAFRDFQTSASCQDRSSASYAFAMLAISRNGMMSNIAKRRIYENNRKSNESGFKAA